MSSLRSPAFVKIIPAGDLAAGGIDFTNYVTDTLTGGAAPLNSLIIQNFSGQRISISYGDRKDIIVRPNSNYIDKQAYGLRSLEIRNLDTVNATDDVIQVIAQRTVTGDDALIAAALGIPLLQVARGDW
jgi:hypothetical protein